MKREIERERERVKEEGRDRKEIFKCNEIFRSFHVFYHDKKIFIVSNFANIYLFYEPSSLFMRKKNLLNENDIKMLKIVDIYNKKCFKNKKEMLF